MVGHLREWCGSGFGRVRGPLRNPIRCDTRSWFAGARQVSGTLPCYGSGRPARRLLPEWLPDALRAASLVRGVIALVGERLTAVDVIAEIDVGQPQLAG